MTSTLWKSQYTMLGSDKYKFIDNLMKLLMLPDSKLLTQRINSLVDSNNLHYGVDYSGFSLLVSCSVSPSTLIGYHIEKGGRITERLNWEPSCHKSLKSEAVKIVLHWKTMENDRNNLILVLRELLAPCRNEQDTRDTLPDCLVQLIPSLNCLPRNREVGYTLSSDSAINLQSVLGTFHTYAAMHLMI